MDMCSLRRRPWSTCCSIWTSSRATSRACIEGCLLTASHRFKREWGWSTRKENSQPEPLLELETPVCFLKANHKRLCSCPQKRLSLCTGTGGYLGVRTPGDLCSDFWDWTASDDSGSGMLDSSPRSSWSLLLRDHLLDSPVGLGSPPRYGSLPLQAVCDTEEGLNLSPSLLSSPAHGLTHLLPQGQELQALFEDVWVTPKSSSPKVPSLPCISSAEKLYLSYPQVSELDDALRNRGGRVSSLSEGENCKGSDITWTPTQGASPRRGSHIHQCKKALRSRSNLKKKCVNGFIMFCRINRKMYLRTHPGTPSTLCEGSAFQSAAEQECAEPGDRGRRGGRGRCGQPPAHAAGAQGPVCSHQGAPLSQKYTHITCTLHTCYMLTRRAFCKMYQYFYIQGTMQKCLCSLNYWTLGQT
ncbi:uncharacterized protein LOC118235095 isoform X5 [Anguilla anguilla]|uniref:uncharacterized protein LOC118235095 isoform X5 n=1 Tax=Anguilla anguilla TaxID=7936 RepID=UPI0015A92337|nr:uncharacterized protein LOC118235095 isoform X5 [Anguilla anguilla]